MNNMNMNEVKAAGMTPDLMQACAEIVTGKKFHGEYIVGAALVGGRSGEVLVLLVVDMQTGEQAQFELTSEAEKVAWRKALVTAAAVK